MRVVQSGGRGVRDNGNLGAAESQVAWNGKRPSTSAAHQDVLGAWPYHQEQQHLRRPRVVPWQEKELPSVSQRHVLMTHVIVLMSHVMYWWVMNVIVAVNHSVSKFVCRQWAWYECKFCAHWLPDCVLFSLTTSAVRSPVSTHIMRLFIGRTDDSVQWQNQETIQSTNT